MPCNTHHIRIHTIACLRTHSIYLLIVCMMKPTFRWRRQRSTNLRGLRTTMPSSDISTSRVHRQSLSSQKYHRMRHHSDGYIVVGRCRQFKVCTTRGHVCLLYLRDTVQICYVMDIFCYYYIGSADLHRTGDVFQSPCMHGEMALSGCHQLEARLTLLSNSHRCNATRQNTLSYCTKYDYIFYR